MLTRDKKQALLNIIYRIIMRQKGTRPRKRRVWYATEAGHFFLYFDYLKKTPRSLWGWTGSNWRKGLQCSHREYGLYKNKKLSYGRIIRLRVSENFATICHSTLRTHVSFYNYSIVNMSLSCIIFEIKRDVSGFDTIHERNRQTFRRTDTARWHEPR